MLLSTKGVNRYKIQNYDFASYASCGNRPGENETVQGKTGARQWVIKEANRPGQYTFVSPWSCSNTDADLREGYPRVRIVSYTGVSEIVKMERQ